MCGLYGGMSSTLVKAEVENIYNLALTSTLRGEDSAGLLTAFHKGKSINGQIVCDVRKEATDTYNFWRMPSVLKWLDETDPFMIAGHSRAATIGKVNRHNAHPFQVKNIWGMHNGTISDLEPPKEKQDKYSDSRLLFELIQEQGIEAAIEKAKDGAYALVYVDLNSATLNFIRNDKRTLYYVRSKGGSLYWSSEKSMLQFMIARGYSQFDTIESFRSNQLYTFRLGSIHSPKMTEINPYPVIKVEPASSTYYDSEYWSYSSEPRQKAPELPWEDTVQKSVIEELHKRAEEENAGKVYKGFGNHVMSATRANDLLALGCQGCGDVSSLRDEVSWYASNAYLCNTCNGDSFHKEYSSHRIRYSGGLIKSGDKK